MMATVLLLMSVLIPKLFFSAQNLQSMLFQISGFGFLVIAQMVVMISGGIDLSIVSIMSVSGISAALIMTKFINETSSNSNIVVTVVLAIFVALIVSLVCGFINGLLIGYIGVPPILATLGTMSLFMGVGIIITGARGIVGFPPGFLKIGTGTILEVPIPFLIFIVISLIIALILNKTVFGLKLYMLGSNPIASIFTGINNKAMFLRTYMLGGFMAGVSSLILIGQANSAKSGYGSGFLIQSIIAVILGGIDPAGGFGGIAGVIIGILVIQMIQSGFNMMGMNIFWTNIIFGTVLLIVMVINLYLGKISLRGTKVLKAQKKPRS